MNTVGQIGKLRVGVCILWTRGPERLRALILVSLSDALGQRICRCDLAEDLGVRGISWVFPVSLMRSQVSL